MLVHQQRRVRFAYTVQTGANALSNKFVSNIHAQGCQEGDTSRPVGFGMRQRLVHGTGRNSTHSNKTAKGLGSLPSFNHSLNRNSTSLRPALNGSRAE